MAYSLSGPVRGRSYSRSAGRNSYARRIMASYAKRSYNSGSTKKYADHSLDLLDYLFYEDDGTPYYYINNLTSSPIQSTNQVVYDLIARNTTF